MEDGEARGRFTFVIRLAHDRAGGISGVLERVRTGEKVRFNGLESVAPTLAAMLERAADEGGRHR